MVRRRSAVLIVLGVLVGVVGLASLTLGTPVVSLAQLLDLSAQPRLVGVVVTELRVPRWAVAAVAGAALGACGLLLQESLRNPLATPELLGVGPGAALVIAVVVVGDFPVPALLLPVFGLAGALAGGALTVLVSRAARGPDGVLLAGAAVGAAVSGIVVAVLSMAEQLQVALLFRYLSGSLAGVTWAQAGPTLIWLAVLLPITVFSLPTLGALRLGDEVAAALGVRPGPARAWILVLVALLVAAVVAVAGPIAWIGFLAPHIARRLVPGDTPGGWLPVTMLAGAACTTVADLAARTAFAPVETPVGAWTAVAGVAYGALLLRRSTPVAVVGPSSTPSPRPGQRVGQ